MEEHLNVPEDRRVQERFILRKFYDFLSCTDRYSEQAHGDAIFVFGHTDPRIAQHAGRLWLEGRADKIILTGKGRKQIAGFDTEADFYASELLKLGVPPEAIILEKESTNTRENAVWGIARCEELSFSPSTLILCAMPPLLRRSYATFEKTIS